MELRAAAPRGLVGAPVAWVGGEAMRVYWPCRLPVVRGRVCCDLNTGLRCQ